METSTEEIIEALRDSLVENERLRRHNDRLTAAAAEPSHAAPRRRPNTA